MTTRRHNPHAFTLVELLVAIVIVGILLSLILVGTSAALAAAKTAATERFLASLSNGMESFSIDHDYYPPILNENYNNDFGSAGAALQHRLTVADFVQQTPLPDDPEDPTNAGPIERERAFNNAFSPVIYLMGVGDLNGDGIETYATQQPPRRNLDDGADGPGLRSPGPDRSWGGARDRRLPSDGGAHNPPVDGRVYGPYVDAGVGSQVVRIREGQNRIRFTFDAADLAAANTAYQGLSCFVDTWGNPVRIYGGWPTLDPDAPAGFEQSPSMLRVPPEIRDAQRVSETIASIAGGQSIEDASLRTVEPAIVSAPYVFLSMGSDGVSGHPTRDEGHTLTNVANDTGGSAGARPYSDEVVRAISDNVRYVP